MMTRADMAIITEQSKRNAWIAKYKQTLVDAQNANVWPTPLADLYSMTAETIADEVSRIVAMIPGRLPKDPPIV